MRTNSKLLVLVAALLTIAALIWSSVSIQAGQKKYEIHPEIILPQYGIGSVRTIDPYERSMERYILPRAKKTPQARLPTPGHQLLNGVILAL